MTDDKLSQANRLKRQIEDEARASTRYDTAIAALGDPDKIVNLSVRPRFSGTSVDVTLDRRVVVDLLAGLRDTHKERLAQMQAEYDTL